MAGAARITAGYDDGPQLFEFAAAGSPVAVPVAHVDRDAVCEVFAAALGGMCASAASVRIEAAGAAKLDWQRRGDGLSVGIDGGKRLAAALVNRDCGGAFEAGDDLGGASVARVRDALAGRLRDSVGGLWPSDAVWTSAAAGEAETFAVHVEVGGVVDRIVCAVVPPPVAPVAPPDHGDWPRRMASALDALAVPVRLILHEGALSVGAARALSVGDVLPIATAHEVGLRVGTFTVARGRMVADAVEITRRTIQERS